MAKKPVLVAKSIPTQTPIPEPVRPDKPKPQPSAMNLIFPTPIPDKYSPFVLKVTHESLLIEHDFELTQKVKIEYYTPDGNGGFGGPVRLGFEADATLSENERDRLIKRYEPFFYQTSTRGWKIDPTTQAIVLADANGVFPEGAVDEKQKWLNVLKSQIPGDKISEAVMALIVQSIGEMMAKKRF